ncbi:SDR family oxidoreductase [Microbacterium terricola]|uniref:Short-chain dehydrogenase n=1 Tax=Microbacterium terricola TaxID=344163 RepID=A0ABM8E1B6_9MICO|nr:SDR family oxidoreductase [Microbacterium terricola]UYK40683.1 SDR family oxidoreductase [Microbacterium terricola]BDV31582.1 short-chain dehydrogenase [Microbacterium terricola]
MPDLTSSVVLVTGANGGIGTQFVRKALERGSSKVYATARNPREWDDPRVVSLRLDVTDQESIAAAVAAAPDVTVLVNNAGISPSTASLLNLSEDELREGMETNFFGPLRLARAFTPVLAAAPGAALINIHSVLSWFATAGVYSVSKAALWSATNALRLELAPSGVHVVGVHAGWVDTPMAAHTSGPKLDPADLVRQVFDAVEADEFEVLADEVSTQVKGALSAPIEALYPQLASATR